MSYYALLCSFCLLCASEEDRKEQDCSNDAGRIGRHGIVLQCRDHAQAFRCHEEVSNGYGAHKYCRDCADQVILSFLCQVHGTCPEDDHSQGLVGPTEVSPDDSVAQKAQGIAESQECTDAQDRDAELQAVGVGLLIDLKPVGERQSCGTKCRITGSDGAGDNAQHGQDHAHRAHGLDADIIDGRGLAVGKDLGKACVLSARDRIQGAACGSPDQGDAAFRHHGAVEYEVSLTLRLEAAGHQGRLGRMEAGDRAAGDRDEHEAPDGSSLRMHAAKVGKDLGNGVSVDGNADGNADGHDDQADAENGIDLSDDLVDGNECGNEVIEQDNAKPYGGLGERTAHALFCKQLHDQACRSDCKYSAYHNQKNDCEYTHDGLHDRSQIDADDLGNGCAVISLGKHAGEIIVYSACKDRSESDPEENDRSPQGSLHRTEDRSEAGNIQKLYQKQFPCRKYNVINAVVDGYSRCFAVIRREGIIYHSAVSKITGHEQRQTDQKT